MANNLYNQNQEEKKYIELKELLKSQGVINGEKLVIFTEHKDTLLYLRERLSNNGYKVAVIHGDYLLTNVVRHNGILCLPKPKYL